MPNRRSTIKTLIAGALLQPFGPVVQAQSPGTYVASPLNFSAVGNGSTDDTAAVIACDAASTAHGGILDGNGRTFAIASKITLKCGSFRNVMFVPAAGYDGPAPTFTTDARTGVCMFESVSGTGFIGGGANVRRSAFAGVHTFRSRGSCKWSNNGNKTQTQLTAEINTSTTNVLPVEDARRFAIGQTVQVGDSGVKIKSIDLTLGAHKIVLLPDGSGGAQLVSSLHFTHPIGQYVTLNQDGKNGLTVGDGTSGFNLDIAPASLQCNSNGWAGFFHWSHQYAGTQNVRGAIATDNGFINLGLGYLNQGEVTGCVALRAGNNGIDTFESRGGMLIHDNISRLNGVDGLFVGGDTTIAQVRHNDLRGNNHSGVNMFGRGKPVQSAIFANNDCRDNFFRSISWTGIQTGTLSNDIVGGKNLDWSIWLEGSNSGWGIKDINLDGIHFNLSAGGKDLGGNAGSFVKGDPSRGSISINHPDYIDHKPNNLIYNVAKS